jgi:hypothetical protein
MLRHDLYRSVHKFIRRELLRFGEKLAQTDFRKIPDITVTKGAFDGIAFDLQMHAQKEEKYFTPLFEQRGVTVHEDIGCDHSKQQAELRKFQQIFEEVIGMESEEERIAKGQHICSLYDQFLSSNLLHFHQEETVLMPALWELYSDGELREITLISYRSMPTPVLLDSTSFFPVLNTLEKRDYLHDLREVCSHEIFLEIWKRALASEDCLTEDEKATFSLEFNLPIEDN